MNHLLKNPVAHPDQQDQQTWNFGTLAQLTDLDEGESEPLCWMGGGGAVPCSWHAQKATWNFINAPVQSKLKYFNPFIAKEILKRKNLPRKFLTPNTHEHAGRGTSST